MAPVGIVNTVLAVCVLAAGLSAANPYYGARIGKFSTHFHGVKGDVYAVDDRTMFIKNFKYDGKGPDTFFWAGTSIRPDPSGFIIADERGTNDVLSAYNGQDLVLRLPEGKRVKDLRWLAIWCKRFRANFGSLIFPKALQPPSPVLIGSLENTKHGVSSGNIMILDTQTFLVPNFTYDGTGNGAHWWISRGLKPNTGGLRLLDENGRDEALKKHIDNTVVISVPEGHSVYDYNTLSVWSTSDIVDYGSVKIPRDVVVPPSPRALGISPENKLNCEMLNDNLGFEARWVINGDQLIMQLVGKVDVNEYMALGLSKDDTETKFTSADAAVTWLGEDGRGHAVDYFLQTTDKCEDGHGMCPDTIHNGADNSLTLLNTAKINDYIMVTFRRPLKAVDKQYDQHIFTDGPQAVLWAVGPILNREEAGPPKLRTRGNLLLDFGRDPIWNCPTPDEATLVTERSEALTVAESVPKIHCPNDYTFRAQMGPPMKADSPARIWYINGLPSPDLIIQRGHTYTFIVEGGTNPPHHHPLYITSNAEGGLYQKVIDADPAGETVYTGVTHDPVTGNLLPTAEGRLCDWSVPENSPEYSLVTSARLSQPALVLRCGPGNAGKLLWTPDANTSELVYYQSFMAKNLGGRIKVVDFCEETDPEHYVEELQRREDSQLGQHSKEGISKESELEREDNSKETVHSLDSIVQNTNGDFHTVQDHGQINSDERSGSESEIDSTEVKDSPSEFNIDQVERIAQKINSGPGIAQERIINNFEMATDVLDHDIHTEIEKPIETAPNMPLENVDVHHGKEVFSLTQSTLDPGASESVFSISSYPHDESERLDLHIPLHSENQRADNANNLPRRTIPVGAHNRHKEDSRENPHRPSHPSNEASAKNTKPPPGFSVQLEGGFVPLILNPSKGKESAANPDYIAPPPHLRRPHRPFLFNESIPFHGTFKPGVPDFSGFNISHYSQEGTILDPNHVLDHQAMLSAPKPQIVQRPLSPMGGLPHELFRRPHGAFPRPQLFGYGPRPEMPLIPAPQQQHMLVQLPPKHHGNFLIAAPDADDLDEGSSQRVQISLQSPNEKNAQKNTVSGIPMMQAPDINRPHRFMPHKVVEPNPPIQRRPDVVEEDDANYRPSQQRPHHTKLHPPRFPNSGLHKNENNPFMPAQRRPPGIGRPLPFQRPPPGGNESSKDRRPPFPFHQRRPPAPQHPARKPPVLFAQRPGAGRPPQIPNMISNNPFQYRLPERPGTNLHLQPPQSTEDISDNSGPQPSHKLQLGPPSLLPYLPSEEIIDENSESYELMPVPSRDHNGQTVLISHDLIPSHDSSKHPPQIFLHRPPNTPDFQEHHPQVNLEQFYVGQPSEIDNQNLKEDNNPPPSKPYLIRQPPPRPESDEDLPLEEYQSVPEDDQQMDSESDKSSKENKVINAENNSENSPKDFVEDKQKLHLPPFGGLESPEDAISDDSPDHESKPFDFHPGDRFFSMHNFEELEPSTKSPVPPPFTGIESANEPAKATEIPLIHIPDEHIGEDIEYAVHELDDYHDVPFGARLSTKLQGDQPAEMKPVFQSPQKENFFPSRRQPQFSSPPSKEVHYIETSTNKPEIQTTKEPPKLYFIPPVEDKGKDMFSKERIQTDKIKIPFIAGAELEKISLATYPGRKNILPSDQRNNYSPPNIPAKAPENIKLPQISEKPPSHDNGTDYSILAHVLSLIGGQPRPMEIVSPRNTN